MSQPLHHIPVSTLKGVGSAMAEKLVRINIHTLQDILFHLPIRYQDRTCVTPISHLNPEHGAVIQGKVISSDIVLGRRRSLLCKISDHTGTIGLRFYHFSGAKKNQLCLGAEVRCFGEPRQGASGLEIYHPEYQVITADTPITTESTLTPIYPVTEGLTQQRIRALCEQTLDILTDTDSLQELLPETLRSKFQLSSLTEAIHLLHQPPSTLLKSISGEDRHPSQRRLAFEELLAHNLSLQKVRLKAREAAGFKLPAKHTLNKPFKEQLPFFLTASQERVLKEICTDMASSLPMLRLIQGDVGSGKTVVAAVAALQAVENDFQAAIMAPTEILAEQHDYNFRGWFKPLGISVAYLSGKTKGNKRHAELERIASGEAMVVIGTHALFQDDVHFHKLGLAVIDEQHRFGVHQRLALRQKGEHAGGQPDQLIMTATPIPRTLAMTAYADLDCSIIDELPPGRIPVNTVIISDDRRGEVIKRLRAVCLEGRQVYWVCTLINESEALQCQAAEATFKQLQTLLTELSIGLVHGRMKASEKATVMAAFKDGHLHVLVATTVIEVGVDVPNASLMIIENPERLGLSQLHQLRGRVGRGKVASHCLLMYHSPLSHQSKERLLIMRNSSDGFVIAEKDLQLRGPGEVMGTKQTGLMQFRVAVLERDGDLLNDVRAAAIQLMEEAPDIADLLIDRWLGSSAQYRDV
ncbi:MAG: ATP-dependent DNA helicase RecG [Candidatus Endonucleobacter bathymodioli]|uniref:ATP-dependent DNA helicase RecG n=1 Tax=Candidatus Endonucleibacter bathymodioli TaxID=539814 RepID=A0AA90P214_9GAMM|nr:ATP-dependent DNA helicase RecG [Candidatus Endonucleobacter bathymodioli]